MIASPPADLDPHLPPQFADSTDRGVTPRVVVLCLVLAVALGYIIPIIDYQLFNTFLGAMHLPAGAVGALLVLILVLNPLFRLFSKRLMLSRNELLTVYISCLFSSLIPGHGGENLIVPSTIAPFYFASRENKWMHFLLPYLKPWLTPAITRQGGYNRALVESWYIGLDPGQSIPWGAWLVPLLFWGCFIFTLYIMLGCLSVMLRAQWTEHEALSFPLLRLPLAMTDYGDPGGHGSESSALPAFFRNPIMWCGFGIAVFIELLNGLNLYFPDVPAVPLGISTSALLTSPPWNQIGPVQVQIWLMAVGIAYLLTSEVSFSLWFFYWFIRFQYILAYSLGFVPSSLPVATGALPGKAFTGYQQAGCYLAYVAIVLWTGREHFRHIARRAFGREAARPGERDEALSYPIAFWGFLLAFTLMAAWTCAAGVRLDIALALWVGYLILAIGLTRAAVEGGVLSLLHESFPLGVVSRLLGSGSSAWLNMGDGLVPASLFQSGIVFHMRGFTMPSFVHSFKLAHDRKIAAGPLLALICAVMAISLSMSLWMSVRLGYDNGGLQLGLQWFGNWGALNSSRFVDAMRKSPTNNAPANWLWLTVGVLLTYGMMLARSRLPWFPFHPLGYLLCLAYPSQVFWFSIFLGWLCKVSITRWGGIDGYRKMTPAFLGLVLGDVAMILFWLAIDGWQGRVGHRLLPA